jgi:hypothetical protein
MLCAALSGCEILLNVDATQCKTDQTCVQLLGRGFTCDPTGVCMKPVEKDAGGDADVRAPLPARWQCLREPLKTFVPDSSKSVSIRMDVVDFNTLMPAKDMTASACNQADTECSTPVDGNLMPGTDGFFQFDLPYGFEGYFTFNAPGFVPGYSFANRPWLENVTESGPALATADTLDQISDHAGMPADPTKGLAIIEIRDCNDGPGDGVTFEPIGDATPFYFDGALPARDLTATIVSTQLAAGRQPRAVGGFSNLPATYSTIIAKLPSGDVVGSITIPIQASYITYLRMNAGY